MRECIKGAGPGVGWQLPPSSGWKHLGYLTFNHLLPSDYIVTVLFELYEGNTPGTEVEYQVTLDGLPHGWFVRRVPAKFPSSQVIRSFISNVAAGQHVLGVRARNLSTTVPVKYSMFWLSPLLVESTETTAKQGLGTDVVVGSTFTTLLQASPSISAGQMVYLGAYLDIAVGTPNHNLEYRILRGASEIARFDDSVPDVLRDGIHFAYIDKTPGAGTVTYTLEARNVSGSSTTFRSRSLTAQSVPGVTVLEGLATNVSVPSNRNWNTIATSNWTSPSAASIGAYGTDGSGFGHVAYNGAFAKEALLKFNLQALSAGWVFEVGVRHVHGTSTGKELEALPSDWEQLGLVTTDQYRVTLQARGLCNTGESMTFSRAQFQIMIVPDNNGFVNPGTCAGAPWACCSQWPSQCTAYTCEASGELAVVSLPGVNCPPV